MPMLAGLRASLDRVVTDADTAIALGSGDVPVLATPRLIAWLEAATVDAVAAGLDPGTTTVGTAVSVRHLAASAVGATIVVSAEVAEVDDERLRFDVLAFDGDGRSVATGTVTRVIVDRARFLRRAGA